MALWGNGVHGGAKPAAKYCAALCFLIALFLLTGADAAFAHAIGGQDAQFVATASGPEPGPFLYLGAKHMVTGYDHLLFLLGVIFFLKSLRQIILYVSLFSLGHSLTLLSGALLGFGLNPWIVDAVIGLSIIWKAFDNIGGFEIVLGFRPDPRFMVLAFGLVHGLGLATKLEDLRLHPDGLLINLLSFNLGVEIGQVIALTLMLGVILLWRRSRHYFTMALAFNATILTAGIVLTGYQVAGYFWGDV